MSEKEQIEKEFLEWAPKEFQRCVEKLIERTGRSAVHKITPQQVIAMMEIKKLRAEDCDSEEDWDDDLLDYINYAAIYKFVCFLQKRRAKQAWEKVQESMRGETL